MKYTKSLMFVFLLSIVVIFCSLETISVDINGNSSNDDLLKVKNFMMDVAVKYGDIALEVQKGKGNLTIEEKEDGTFFTEVDMFVNQGVVKELVDAELFPSYRVIGEESLKDIKIKDPLEHGFVFYVDPIDGTDTYIARKCGWCVIISLVKDGEPLISVVYKPCEKIVVWSITEVGAFAIEDGVETQIRVKDVKNIPEDVVFAVSSLKPPETMVKMIMEIEGIELQVFEDGSFATRLVDISNGTATIYINFRSSYWDSSGPQGMLREAGGECYDFNTKEPIFYDGMETLNEITICVAHPDLWKRYEPMLKTLIHLGF